jgi:hypothetical protein
MIWLGGGERKFHPQAGPRSVVADLEDQDIDGELDLAGARPLSVRMAGWMPRAIVLSSSIAPAASATAWSSCAPSSRGRKLRRA